MMIGGPSLGSPFCQDDITHRLVRGLGCNQRFNQVPGYSRTSQSHSSLMYDPVCVQRLTPSRSSRVGLSATVCGDGACPRSLGY